MADRALAILGARYRSYKDDGTVNSGGLIYFYEAGTTTLKDTYSDPEKTTANANPVVLNTRGEAAIYGAGAYKIVEQDSSGTQLGDAMDGVLLLDVSDDMLALLSSGTLASLRSSMELGSAATKDAGTSAGEVLLLAETDKLPALDGSNLTNIAAGAAALPHGYKFGFTLSRSANQTLGISAGACRDSTNAKNMSQSSAFTKTLASWSAGTGNGSLDTGSAAVSTWYHAFAIYNATSSTSDFLISASPTSPTMPTGYAYFRRIGSFKTDGSVYITDFSQVKDLFYWKAAIEDRNAAGDGNLNASATNATLTVPTGVQVEALVTATAGTNGVAGVVYFSSPDQNDEAPSSYTTAPFGQLSVPLTTGVRFGSGQMFIRTNTSAQIRVRPSQDAYAIDISTLGWREYFN